MSGLLDKFLNMINPDECLISGEILPEVREYRYISSERLLELSPPPHPLTIRDRLLSEYNADELAISKIISLFKINENDNVLNPIHKFKYMGITQIGIEFGTMLSKLINPNEYDLIIPIPIHHARKRERGFNQSEIMGQSISDKTSIPLCLSSLIRSKYTYSQAKLNREERKFNLSEKFKVIEKDKIYNKRLLLIDDVLTTGTTANHCAEILLKAGARRVDLAVIAVSY
ncbi:MAG: phosphoribosyltransferase family protein [Candidatus Kapaibacterium sp.]